jgi:putative ABC transport system permease protein
MEFALPRIRYAPQQTSGQQQDTSRLLAFYQRLSEEIRQLPGVVAAGEVNTLPLGGKDGRGRYIEAGKFRSAPQEFDVSGDYFRALGIAILEGRSFTVDDLRSHANVIVINQDLARRGWPGDDPLGKTIKVSGEPPREVVGVVSNVSVHGLGEKPQPQYYLPAQQLYMTLIVRTAADPRAIGEAIRERMRRIDAGVPLFNIRTLQEVVADSTSAPRFRGIVVSVLAALAFVLAGFGLYSVVAYSVTCRTHELGVRMALGAQPRDIRFMVTREGMWLGLTGIALGAQASFWLNRLIVGLLYGVRPNDPTVFATAVALLIVGTIGASLTPALRASRTDPASALRHE